MSDDDIYFDCASCGVAEQNVELEGEILRLRATINEQSDAHVAHVKGLHEKWEAERKILVNEVEKLRAALKPFADISGLIPEKYTDDSEWWTDIYEVSLAMPTVGDIRAAAAAIKETRND